MELRGIGTTRRRRPVGAIPPTGPEYRFQRSISIDPTIGSRSNFVSQDSEGCFRWSSIKSIRHVDGVQSGPFHRQDQSTGSKVQYLLMPPLDRAQIFSRVCGGYFRWSCVEWAQHVDGVRSGPFHRQDESTR